MFEEDDNILASIELNDGVGNYLLIFYFKIVGNPQLKIKALCKKPIQRIEVFGLYPWMNN